MNALTEKRMVIATRWIARILGVLLLWLIVFLAVGQVGQSPIHEHMHLREAMLGASLFTMLAGLIAAWKWEGAGGLLILAGFAAFAMVNGRRRFVLKFECVRHGVPDLPRTLFSWSDLAVTCMVG